MLSNQLSIENKVFILLRIKFSNDVNCVAISEKFAAQNCLLRPTLMLRAKFIRVLLCSVEFGRVNLFRGES